MYNSFVNTPRLILLNGFAGSGKTTLAKRYIDEHPLALAVEGDEIIVRLGQWKNHKDEARKLIFEITKSLVATHLKSGHDVIMPYLLTNLDHAVAFENIATENHSDYCEIFLFDEKKVAVDRLLQRGTWGEEGLAPLTEKDLPAIEDLYDRMLTASIPRKMQIIRPTLNEIESTYQQLLELVSAEK